MFVRAGARQRGDVARQRGDVDARRDDVAGIDVVAVAVVDARAAPMTVVIGERQ